MKGEPRLAAFHRGEAESDCCYVHSSPQGVVGAGTIPPVLSNAIACNARSQPSRSQYPGQAVLRLLSSNMWGFSYQVQLNNSSFSTTLFKFSCQSIVNCLQNIETSLLAFQSPNHYMNYT